MDIIKIGKVTSPVGLKGEVKIISYSDDQYRFEMLQTLFCNEQKYLRAIGTAGQSHETVGQSRETVESEVLADAAPAAAGYVRLAIEGVRYKGSGIILKLEGIDDRNASEKARGMELFMDADELPELEEGQFYVRDIVGFEVSTEEGELLGTLKDVLTNTAQDVYIVSRAEGGKDIMIPGVAQFILSVDQKNRKVTVRLPEGLLEL